MKIAILDLYEGEANEGMRCIQALIEQFMTAAPFPVSYEVFDVRQKLQVPDLSFHAYISSGGPGSPITSQGSAWEQKYFHLMDGILRHNRNNPQERKHVLLICHSFQIYCRHYNYAKVAKRKSTAFGVMPIHKTKEGSKEPLLAGLPETFYAVDSRDYQIVSPNEGKIWSGGGQILCMEKHRPLVKLERAIMAIRFDEAIVGMQFHGEADADGMYRYLLRADKKKIVVEKHGEKKYLQMLQYVNDPEKIRLTYNTIVPNFLQAASRVAANVTV